MRTRLTLQPDQDGAKQLREQYGDRLVCVRYRDNEVTQERWKTVELIIEKSTWEPPLKWEDNTLVSLQVAPQERAIRQRVKAAGGKWNPREVVWELPYGQVVALGMTDRIVSKGNTSTRSSHIYVDGREKSEPSTNR
jgi:hypothetical protein